MIMKNITFQWDGRKAELNGKKHGIGFNEAKTVFYDENAKIIHDPDHSKDEDRFIILGLSITTQLLVVCHCYREPGNVIRIISARKATKKEARQYGGSSNEKRI